MNPRADPSTDPKFVQGKDAIIASERHMFIVLKVFRGGKRLKVAVIESHQDTGLARKSGNIKALCFCLQDEDTAGFVNLTPNRPVLVHMYNRNRPIGNNASINVTNTTTIALDEDIYLKIGYCEAAGVHAIEKLCSEVEAQAATDSYEEDLGGEAHNPYAIIKSLQQQVQVSVSTYIPLT